MSSTSKGRPCCSRQRACYRRGSSPTCGVPCGSEAPPAQTRLNSSDHQEAAGSVRDGLYESIVTAALNTQIEAAVDLTATIDGVDAADEVHVLTHHIADAIGRRLRGLRGSDERLRLTNELLRLVEADEGSVEPPTRQLLAMYGDSTTCGTLARSPYPEPRKSVKTRCTSRGVAPVVSPARMHLSVLCLPAPSGPETNKIASLERSASAP